MSVLDTLGVSSTDVRIERHATQLSRQLKLLREKLFPPLSQKALRTFTSGEAAQMIGVSDGYLRQLSLDGETVPETTTSERRSYTLGQTTSFASIWQRLKDAGNYVRGDAPAAANDRCDQFKGGSAKTTTTLYLAEYLALCGYRVHQRRSIPRHLSSMLGLQPEFDLKKADTLWRHPLARAANRCVILSARPISMVRSCAGQPGTDGFEHETPRALDRQRSNGEMFFKRVGMAIAEVEDDYDIVVIDRPTNSATPRLVRLRGNPAYHHSSADGRRRVDIAVPADDVGSAIGRAQSRRRPAARLHQI